MEKSRKEIKKEIDERRTKGRYKYDSDGRVIVNMTVKNDDDFLSVFSESETPVISDVVADFIESSTASIPPKENLTLKIRSNCIDEREKVLYEKAIKEYYTEKYVANERELKRNTFIVCLLAIMGVLVLACELIFEYQIGNAIWAEVIDIVAWVLLWEAVDIGVFGGHALRTKRNRCLSYLSMKIEYVSE